MFALQSLPLADYAIPFAPASFDHSLKRKAVPAKEVVNADKLGIDNIVKLGIDSILLIKQVGPSFSDGFQATDIFVVIQQYPKIVSIGMVAKPAFAEIRNLDPQEAKEAAQRIADGAKIANDGTVWGRVAQGLALGARTYNWFDEGKVILYEWKNIFDVNKTAFFNAENIDAEDIRA